MMIIVCRDGAGDFHLVRSIQKDGLSMKVRAYCGADGLNQVDQLPAEFQPRLGCEACEAAYQETKAAANG